MGRPWARVWPQLPPELVLRIAGFLPGNDVACGLRLVNKAAAELLSGPLHATVRLSQPVPPPAFAHRWAAPDSARDLSYRQRLQLLCLTAASGVITNLQVALAAAGCLPTRQVLDAAAAAGQLEVCEWLLLTGGCRADNGTLESAAAAGQRRACEWLLAAGHAAVTVKAAAAAARGGHLGLLRWLAEADPWGLLRQQQPLRRSQRLWVLVGAAEGCGLADLQALSREWQEFEPERGREEPAALAAVAGQQGPEAAAAAGGAAGPAPVPPADEAVLAVKVQLLAAAAGSLTPDWAAKVEWLEWLGCPRSALACEAAAARPDGAERIAWLRRRGHPADATAALAAARAGNLAALQHLLAEGVPIPAAAAAWQAAKAGALAVLAWLVETPGVGAVALDAAVFGAAAASGDVGVMAWLRERGCSWAGAGDATFARAAAGGSAVALEWLAARGCEMGRNGEALYQACARKDLATLGCLLRLGCPWGPPDGPGAVFVRASRLMARFGCGGPLLRWLLAAGCPADWRAAEAAVRRLHTDWPGKEEVLQLLREEEEEERARLASGGVRDVGAGGGGEGEGGADGL
ncbi:hypothetical protein GPECTOR_22g935 [Gonium pectorale]|uniref:F-box domain-containing protein n=1 Tax=Gonium pectorale TaxID=33097 RepID=A0A150GHL4_GONPE|nr:hypothetical protein GPECTOR_22g935 [Gonium pectorale]|eukprot:KXZ49341.1 hypothetical protein GPECTOR_22g935 [Gonium pectorale]